MATDASCTKCRTKREIKDATAATTANGRHALQGVCPVCGAKHPKGTRRLVAGPVETATKS